MGVLERRDVEAMLAKTRLDRILEGFRGPALDRDAVIELAIRSSTKSIDAFPAWTLPGWFSRLTM